MSTIDLNRDIVRPLIALALGLLPLTLFGGASSRTTVNGAVVACAILVAPLRDGADAGDP